MPRSFEVFQLENSLSLSLSLSLFMHNQQTTLKSPAELFPVSSEALRARWLLNVLLALQLVVPMRNAITQFALIFN